MNPLAWNFEISQRMRTQPQIALGLLPIGLMFASFVPLVFLAAWLSSALGIYENSATLGQQNGLLWLVIFLVAMVLLMVAGYILGWVLNGFILRIFFKWPPEKVWRVLLYSEVPPSWLKEGSTSTDASDSSAPINTAWAVARQKGKWHFIFQRGIIAWGLPMYLFMACLPAINGKVEATTIYFFWQACIWGFAGASFGFIIWHFSEKSFLKQHGNQEP